MNNTIDLAFLTAKVATLKDEKAKMIVEGASLAYNITQVARFRSMIVELSQICNYIVYKARITRGYTPGEYNLALECQRQIEECNKQIAKHETMTMVDGISLLIDMLGNLNKNKSVGILHRGGAIAGDYFFSLKIHQRYSVTYR